MHLKTEFQKDFRVFLQIVNWIFTTKTMYLLKLFQNPRLFQVTLILKTISEKKYIYIAFLPMIGTVLAIKHMRVNKFLLPERGLFSGPESGLLTNTWK